MPPPRLSHPDLSEKEQAIVTLVLELTGQLGGPRSPQPALRAPPEGLADLTPRERDVLPRLLRGMTTKQIALALGLSPRTVTSYRVRVLLKLGVKTSMQLSHLFHGEDVTALLIPLHDAQPVRTAGQQQ